MAVWTGRTGHLNATGAPAVADYIVAGTGPRRLQVADRETCARAVEAVTEAVAGLKQRHGGALVVMSGMAEGFDSLLAWAALRAGVRLWCAVPNRGYGAYYWGRYSLTGTDRTAEFTRYLHAAWRRTFVTEDVYGGDVRNLNGVHSNLARNVWMVEQADEFLVWDPISRGTARCLAGIQKAGKPYRILSDQQQTLPVPGSVVPPARLWRSG